MADDVLHLARQGVRTLQWTILMGAALGGAMLVCAAGDAWSQTAVAASELANPRVTVEAVDAPIVTVLKLIAERAGLIPAYNEAVLPPQVRITVHMRDMPVADAFREVLRGTGVLANVQRTGYVTLVHAGGGATGQTASTIVGTVTDAKTKRPLAGVAIVLDGSPPGVMTDANGRFRFANVVVGEHRIIARVLGHSRQVRTVAIVSGRDTTVDFVMEKSTATLDQVIVTGTVIQTERKQIANAMSVITANDIEQRGITHIDQLFRGDVPGMFAQNRGSGAVSDGGGVTLTTRGTTSLVRPGDRTSIKTYVDGVELADSKYLNQIDPRSIERIEIVTGPQATTIYGSNALNGVMQVFTKRGTTSRPQVTATLLSGLVENNASSATTPQHDYSAQVSGMEGLMSYNIGGTWTYTGPWTPAMQSAQTGGYGGARLQRGIVTADATLRMSQLINNDAGVLDDAFRARREAGYYYFYLGAGGRSWPLKNATNTKTLGFTLGVAPLRWWSHEFVAGTDASQFVTQSLGPARQQPSDSLLIYNTTDDRRISLRYATTARVPVTSRVNLTVTAGADNWTTLTNSLAAQPAAVTGSITNVYFVRRQPDHNAGAFVQGQMGIAGALFVTYGLRAEWNPNYGADAAPNLAPKAGLAYTRDVDTRWGAMTVKLRASYGKATRPPLIGQKTGFLATDPRAIAYYGVVYGALPNPALGAEYQKGSEGGMELYFGNRASLVVTRYNQTVDDLIWGIGDIDSVRSIIPIPIGMECCIPVHSLDANRYGFLTQSRTVNAASIRNQGWELQGTTSLGPFTARGTYSFTKNRALGPNPQYQHLLTGYQFTPGSILGGGTAEHTWMAGLTYNRAVTSIGFTLNGVGQLYRYETPDLCGPRLQVGSNSGCDRVDETRRNVNSGNFLVPSYVLGDLNVSHRFTRVVESVIQIQNIGNVYSNDQNAKYSVIGRQSKIGLRVRW